MSTQTPEPPPIHIEIRDLATSHIRTSAAFERDGALILGTLGPAGRTGRLTNVSDALASFDPRSHVLLLSIAYDHYKPFFDSNVVTETLKAAIPETRW